MKISALAPLALLLAMGCAAMERTADPDDRARDLIHSDTPLLAKGEDEYWPNELARDDAFGCASRVAFGDWLFREENGGSDADFNLVPRGELRGVSLFRPRGRGVRKG